MTARSRFHYTTTVTTASVNIALTRLCWKVRSNSHDVVHPISAEMYKSHVPRYVQCPVPSSSPEHEPECNPKPSNPNPRCVYTAFHDTRVIDAEDEKEGTCVDWGCVGRVVSVTVTALLIVMTAVAYFLTSYFQEDLILATGFDSTPNIILTVIKTVIPMVVIQLVAFEKWSSAEKASSEP